MVLAKFVIFAGFFTYNLALTPRSLQSIRLITQDSDSLEAPTQLLQAFGLSEPGVRRRHAEPPQYMLDLYNQLADSNGLTRLLGPYGATVIRAFSEKDGSSESTFVFSLSGLHDEEQILEAELHIYHSKLQKLHRHQLEDNHYLLEVSTQIEGISKVINKQHVTSHSGGWKAFPVGAWLINHLKTMSTTTAPMSPSVGEEQKIVLFVTARTLRGNNLSIDIHHGYRGTRRPLLILFNSYVQDRESLPISPEVPEKKKSDLPLRYRLRRSAEISSSLTDVAATTASAITTPTGCERRDMIVDFASIGWSSWIVSPAIYNAFQCVGECRFPIGQNLNPTNHATVQSIINHNSGEFPKVQRPCCVPSAYANLSLLYYDAEENVVLKQYDQMVATECGCH